MTEYKRRESRKIQVGRVAIGGNAPISIQSMTNTNTMDFAATLAQVRRLEEAGCDVVRITVPNPEAAKCIYYIKDAGVEVPLVADIHFDYRAALFALEAGVDKIRINPGNIGGEDRVKELADAARRKNVPIRIGVNSGSLEKSILAKHGAPTAAALCESAMYHTSLLEKFDFNDIAISIKASSVMTTIEANRLLARTCNYPIHIGVTEAGGEGMGTVKSAIGIGTLLAEGIGDTVRVSLTADPVKEIAAAEKILDSLGLSQKPRLNIVSCPTCGRTRISLIELLAKLEDAIDAEELRCVPVTVALMGCAVNGPGEAREADIGIAGGDGDALLFYKGVTAGKIPQEMIVPRLIEEIKAFRDANI
ncbi:MAG: flavodoxin-dependent (E)-4-hydroxy-3-methylbut-2-enyl-diphosphate synthase [Ruminococcaceae bacterium]|nr:flavodoxin-dependent (E)-4-hydroxy-3-methylbut-2-enyl-diphosphate synthase [Oscillospiraceae bacterium]